MAMPKVLDWLDDLVAKVATNTTNIANNKKTIEANKKLFDTHVADDNRHWTTADRQNFDRVVHFKGYFTTIDKLKKAYPTGQLGDYAIVGGTDTVWLWDDETNSWLNSTEQGIVISVNGRTGEVILTKTDVGLSNVDNTSDKNKPISTAAQTALDKKADRKNITQSEADSLNLRSGIYNLDKNLTILDYTSDNWNIIVGEQTKNNLSATQIWIPYSSNSEIKIFLRHQKSQNSWSDFKEILTDAHFTTLQNQITENAEHIATNTTDISKLNINKANRGEIALSQANAIDGLQSGIYSLANTTVTLAGDKFTNDYFTVIVGDWVVGNTIRQGTQIWMCFSSTAAYIRHQKLDTDGTTRVWGDFIKIANQAQINNLQSQINTNKTNIANLTSDKADRKKITLSQANSLTLKAGIYNLQGNSLTILGEASAFWTIIVGEYNDNGKSVTQIWMPYIYGNSVKPKMFIRRALSDSNWSAFTEVLTTDIASRDDIARFKQYKGYYATASDLKTALTTSSDGDYAIVGSALYIWNSKQSTWTEVSGSGGSTGTNKWSIKQYSVPEYTKQTIPQFKDIVGKTLDRQWEIEDTDSYLLNEAKNDYKCYLFETYVNMEEALEYSSTNVYHNDGINVFVNNKSIYSSAVVGIPDTISIPVVTGWNKIQVLLCEVNSEEFFRLGIKFTSSAKCLGMDCYHAETEPVGGYVPLVGNSTIEGTLTINKIATPSNSLVSNLNADLLDGKHASDFATAKGLTDLTTQVNTNTGNILDNAKKIQSNTEQIGTNKDDITNLKTQIKTAEANIKTNTTDISSLKTKTDTTNTNVTNLTKRVSTNETDITALKTKTNTTNTNVTNLTSKVNANATNIKTNADAIAALKTKTDTTNTNVKANTDNIDKILKGTATIPSVAEAENAKNAEKLGGQLPAYYAKKTDLDNYLPLKGGTLTGKTVVVGTAQSASFWARGIMGCSSDGSTEDALFLNYNNKQPVYINGENLVYHSGNIPKASTTTQGIVKLNDTRTSTSTSEAATANAVKGAYDTLNTALTNHKNDTNIHLTAVDRTILTKANKFKGYFETETALNKAFPKGEAGDYAIVNTTDTVWIWDADKEGGAGWKDGAGKGSVISVNNMTGEVVLTKSNIGLGNVDNTSDKNKPVSTAQQTALDKKVNKAGDTMTGVLKITNNTAAGSTATGALVVTGGIYTASNIVTQNALYIAHGTPANAKIFLNAKEAIKGVDGWLRINEAKAFTSGVYFGNGLTRTDGNFQVGNNGESLNVTPDGIVTSAKSITAGTDLKTKSGIVNYNDKAQVKYNATDECIEFIFS